MAMLLYMGILLKCFKSAIEVGDKRVEHLVFFVQDSVLGTDDGGQIVEVWIQLIAALVKFGNFLVGNQRHIVDDAHRFLQTFGKIFRKMHVFCGVYHEGLTILDYLAVDNAAFCRSWEWSFSLLG
jgi:hypothetical protein